MSNGIMQLKDLPELEIGQDRWVSKPGRYGFIVAAAEPGMTAKGFDKVALRGAVEAPGTPDDGVTFFDHLAINGESGAYFKRKLRQLGVPVDSDGVSVQQICQHLVGKRFFVDLDLEQAMTKDANGAYTLPKFHIDANGQKQPSYQSRPTAYYQHGVGGQAQPVQQPVQQVAPAAQFNGAVATAPQGGFGAPPPGFAPQTNGGAPAGFGPPAGTPAPWATAPAAQPAQAEVGGGGKRGKK